NRRPNRGAFRCIRSSRHGSEPALEQVAPFDERANLAIDNAALQHPEPAVRMDVLQTVGPDRLDDPLDAGRDEIGALDLVVLDVHDADAEADSSIEIGEDVELL